MPALRLVSAQRFANRDQQGGQTGLQIFAEMHSQGAAAALHEHLKISTRLGRFDDSEGILLPGHSKVGRIVAGDLQEDARIRPALVRLASGMEEARTKSQARGDTFLVAQ